MFAEASQLQSEGLRIARENKLLLPVLYSLQGYGLALIGKGDYDEALSVLREGLALAEKVGAEVRMLRFLNRYKLYSLMAFSRRLTTPSSAFTV